MRVDSDRVESGKLRRSSAQGFTLLELVIVLTLSSLLAVMVAQPLASVFQARTVFEDEVTAKEELNYALMRMGREAREGQWVAGADGEGSCGPWELEGEGRLVRNGEPFLLQGEDDFFRLVQIDCREFSLSGSQRSGSLYELEITLRPHPASDQTDTLRTLVYPRS